MILRTSGRAARWGTRIHCNDQIAKVHRDDHFCLCGEMRGVCEGMKLERPTRCIDNTGKQEKDLIKIIKIKLFFFKYIKIQCDYPINVMSPYSTYKKS